MKTAVKIQSSKNKPVINNELHKREYEMHYKITSLLICILLTSCGGLRTFHEYARAGDTVAVPVGMKPDFSKDNITVTITPSIGSPIVLDATAPAIRAIINLYPDPISNMIISREIGEDISPSASTYGYSTLYNANNDKDYFQTTVFVDLPLTLPTGLTQIEVNNGTGTSHTATLNVIPGTGTTNTFDSDFNGGLLLSDAMLDSLSRAPHITVTFDSTVIPYAIEITFTHDPDKTIGGTGQAFVTNPLGSFKNLTWSDDGTTMKVILMANKKGIIDDIKDYKFYITGTTTNIQLTSVTGYGNNGDQIDGVSATLTQN